MKANICIYLSSIINSFLLPRTYVQYNVLATVVRVDKNIRL